MFIDKMMSTAMIQLHSRIKNKAFSMCVTATIAVFIAFMVIGRLVSGVHWITDIIGGAIVSTGLVILYCFVCGLEKKEKI